MRLPGWADRRPFSRVRGRHLLVLTFYTLLALGLSYPLVLHMADGIAGVQGDVWSYVWAMGWARSSIELGVNPFHNDYVFYPLGGATQLLWASALPSFASLPLQYAFGLIPAFNLTYLAATVLSAYGTYLLAREVLGIRNSEFGIQNDSLRLPQRDSLRSELAACIAGVVFAFCALRLGYGLAFTNLYHTELIPFYVLFLLRATRRGRVRDAALAGIMLGLNAYIDFQIAAFLALFSVLWVLAVVVGSVRALGFRRQIPFAVPFRAAAVVAVVGLAIAAPMGVMVVQDLATEGGNYIRVYPLQYSAARSYDLLSFILPNARSSLYQALPSPRVAGINAAVNVEGESQLSPDRQSFLGLTALALAVIGAWRRPRALAFWIVATLFFALLAMGPVLHVGGSAQGIPLPYAALHEIPIANHIRIPMRYGIMVFLGLAVLAGAGVQVLAARFHPVWTSGVLIAVILAEAAVLPYPMLAWSVPGVYAQIARDPGDFTVLEIPTFNWRPTAATEVYQVLDGKRLLRAYTNRIAPDIADYFAQRQTPIVTRSLRVLEGAEEGPLTPEQLAEDRAAAAAVTDFFQLRYVVLHTDWLDQESVAPIDRYLRETLGARPLSQEGDVRAYVLDRRAQSPGPQEIDLTSDTALMYLGRGWQTEPRADVEGEQGRYMREAASEVYFRLGCEESAAPAACDAAAVMFRGYSEKSGVVLQWEVDGRRLGEVTLKQGWADYRLALPPGLVPGGMHVLRLRHPTDEASFAVATIEIH
ncbi:MAG: hypothetical protein WCF84_01710 [Anaerolineae bacterium]